MVFLQKSSRATDVIKADIHSVCPEKNFRRAEKQAFTGTLCRKSPQFSRLQANVLLSSMNVYIVGFGSVVIICMELPEY